MTRGDRRARVGAPISIQLVALLLACLVAAQAISFAVIVLTPPPRPSVYRLAEVAQALKGGPLSTRFARPMTRVSVAKLPSEFRTEAPGEPLAQTLAEHLGASAADVRLVQRGPSPMWRILRQLAGGAPQGGFRRELGPLPQGAIDERRIWVAPAPGPVSAQAHVDVVGPGEQGPARIGGFVARGRGPNGDWLLYGAGPGAPTPVAGARLAARAPLGTGDIPILGQFAAAVRNGDGGWTIVRSAPEPFPNDWQRRSLMWLLGGFLLVAPAGYLFSRRITGPLKRFSEAAERLGRDPRAPPMTLSGPAEVGAAAHAFNEMQDRLKRYISDRTAMVGAISHDLRTPLARIRFKIEAAPPRLRDSINADIAHMEKMIDGVLAFIRDEGTPRSRERLDLLSLVECVADDAALMGSDVEILDACPADVEGDPVVLRRLFGNLVDNAVKYGGEARIRVRCHETAAVVEIADRGPGLPPAELEQVFRPFYRADASRNLDIGGVGLGLPIARSSARAHGGDVELVSGATGVTAVVTLPLAPKAA